MDKLGKVLITLAAVVLWVSSAQAFVTGEFTDDAKTVGLYHLNQSSGTTVLDDASSGRTAHDGTLIGTTPPTWTAGDYGNGLHMTTALNSNGAISLGTGLIGNTWHVTEMDLKWDYLSSGPIAGDTGFVGYLYTDASPGKSGSEFVRTYIDSESNPGRYGCRLEAVFQCYDGWRSIITPLNFSLQADVWTHVAIVADWRYDDPTPNDFIGIYINGQLAASSAQTPDHARYTANAGILTFGSVASPSWGGTIDEIRISSGRRDPSEFAIPEPATMALLLVGGLAALRKRG